jgi:hypothetical protein
MMKSYMTTGALTKSKKPEGGPPGKAVAPFPGEEAIKSIYGGPVPHEFWCKLKLTRQAVNAMLPHKSNRNESSYSKL